MLTEVQVGSVSPHPPLLLLKASLLQPWSFMVYCELLALSLEQVLTVLLKLPSFPENIEKGLLKDLEKQLRPEIYVPPHTRSSANNLPGLSHL